MVPDVGGETMSATATMPEPVATSHVSRRWRVTRDEYYKLTEHGYFNNRRVELIGGEVIVMPAMTNWHAVGIELTANALRAAFGPDHWVRIQMTLDLTETSAPDPDLAVMPEPVAAYRGQRENPSSALLIVEVSYSTVSEDRSRKGSLYASVGIADYWIVNIDDGVLEVYRDPQPDPSAEFGASYSSRTILRPGRTASPLAATAAIIRVEDLLPA